MKPPSPKPPKPTCPSARDLAAANVDLQQLRDFTVSYVRTESRDMTMRQLAILLTTRASRRPLSNIDVSEHLQTNKPTVTRGFDRLVDLGLAQRFADPRDGRRVDFRLTEAGLAHCNLLGRIWHRAKTGQLGGDAP